MLGSVFAGSSPFVSHRVSRMMFLFKDEIASSMSAQILEFSESELFPETLQVSEVGSSSNCGYEEHSSYSTNLPPTPDMHTFSGGGCGGETKDIIATVTETPNSAAVDNNHLSIVFDTRDEIGNDISASIDFGGAENFSLPPQFLNHPANNLDQFDMSSFDNNQVAVGQQYPPENQMMQLMAPPQMVYDEECLPSVPPYLHLASSSPSCSFLDPNLCGYLPGNLNPGALSADNSGVFSGGGFFLGGELTSSQDLDFQGDNSNRLFCPDNIPRVYNCHSDQFQALNSENQHLVSGGGGSSTGLTSDITCLEDTTFKVGKLSVEERKEKIHRYLKKKNERNFSKKIKYACRKTLADSRPRVRGRFAKNDDFGDMATRSLSSMGSQEDDPMVDMTSVTTRHNFLYDPNYPTAFSQGTGAGGRSFNSNCLPPSGAGPIPGPYDMCNTLFFADANMQR
ncbi:unnamed protein product [Cuscuta epithymum]|uniref:CCT domain-containing protein n=2 Tax=Cuscuta epithymum TaxID=186058 RepID=A0AAV0D487_9ASTE|nr:unnamed protein product [Cuscuta epithymum]